ncbi:MAG: zinc-ribbon domain-containing protein, partial [Ignavibacteriae bacterium]|nr:zinc-ribbon domain-containing protein [Ignavibacteriota bacterium]
MNYCGKCGNKLNPNAKFCPKCGKQLVSQNQNVQPPPLLQSQPQPQLPGQNQNIPAPPPSQPQAPPNKITLPAKKKSKKGLLIYIVLIAFVFIISLILIFSTSTLFKKSLTGKIEFKPLDEDKIVNNTKYGSVVINEFCLVLKDDFGRKDAEKIASRINGKITGELEYINLYQVELSSSSEEKLTIALNEARKSECTQYAFANSILDHRDFTNSACNPFEDTVYSGTNGFAFKMLGIKEAWDIIKASGVELKEVTVGVVDAQVNTLSKELRGEANIKILDEKQNSNLEILKREFNKSSEQGQDFYGRYQTHGNEVTNIIAANSKNGGITGIASILGNKLNVNVNDAFSLDDKEKEKFKDMDDYRVEKTLGEKGKKSTVTELANILEQV